MDGTKDSHGVESSVVGPLPTFAVHGTVSLKSWNPRQVQILSLIRKKEDDLPLSVPSRGDVTMETFLEENIGIVVDVGVSEGGGINSRIKHYQKCVWT